MSGLTNVESLQTDYSTYLQDPGNSKSVTAVCFELDLCATQELGYYCSLEDSGVRRCSCSFC